MYNESYKTRWSNPSVYKGLTLCMMGNFSCFCCRLLTFFKINFFNKFFQEHYQSVKQFGSRSGSKLFAKVISRRNQLPLVRKLKSVGNFRTFFVICPYLSLFPCIYNISTVKPVLSGHSKEDQQLVFKTDYCLIQVKSIAECSKSAFCNTFNLH